MKKNIERAIKEGGFREEIDTAEIPLKKRESPVTAEKVEKITLSGGAIERIYGIDEGTLANYRSLRKGCKFFKVGKRVFYRKDDFEKWFFGHPSLTIDSITER